MSSESCLCLTPSFPWLSLGASRVQMPTAAICHQLLHLMTGECRAALETQKWFISLDQSVGHNAWRCIIRCVIICLTKDCEAYLRLKIPLNGLMKASFCCAFPVPLQTIYRPVWIYLTLLFSSLFFVKEHQFTFLRLSCAWCGIKHDFWWYLPYTKQYTWKCNAIY